MEEEKNKVEEDTVLRDTDRRDRHSEFVSHSAKHTVERTVT